MKNNNEIIPFDFNGRNVRVIKDEDDNPWFVGKDICVVLGIKYHRDAINRLDKDECRSVRLDGIINAGNPNMTLINEVGLYTLILRSDKPQAKKFKKWVTHEVLPSIRKHGGYVHNVDLFIDTFFVSVSEEERPALKQILENNINSKKKLEEQKPAVEFFEKIMKSDASFSVSATAKILKFPGIGRNILFKILREEGLLMDSKDEFNMPYQWTINKGWFETSPKIYDSGKVYTQVFVLPKGMEAIRNILNK